jgi:hypothetical protein
MVAVEVVGLEEQEDAAAGLIADEGLLPGRGGAGEEDGGGALRRAGRSDKDPALVLPGLDLVGERVKPSLPVNQAIASS